MADMPGQAKNCHGNFHIGAINVNVRSDMTMLLNCNSSVRCAAIRSRNLIGMKSLPTKGSEETSGMST